MHDIPELERQYEAATQRLSAAAKAKMEARDRLMEARFEASGFKGCIAEDRRGRQFLPESMGRWDHVAEIRGPALKKDGTPGERMISEYVEKCINRGPRDE